MKSDIIQISDALFIKLGKMISEKYGIKMPIEKKIMFQSRMQRRLQELNIGSFDEYADLLQDVKGQKDEFSIMADYISTNKTEFFRENAHFNFLSGSVLPKFQSQVQGFRLPIMNIWSAGCSSGQESYSICITIEEFMRSSGFNMAYYIMATDISTRMLKTAKEAIYPMTVVDDISLDLKQKYFLKSKGLTDSKVRVAKEIRDKVRFAYLNLMDDSYHIKGDFHVIFLRNTLIYFEPAVQKRVLNKVLERLVDGGYLFIGHSESLINMNLPIRSIAPSVYIKNK
ncbi:MAG TPA: chemotaxis protein CheR [Prolixibacteraceae bacterium]|nr:chemotaxis protein CheR [Prolixibacteraceae bacterium]